MKTDPSPRTDNRLTLVKQFHFLSLLIDPIRRALAFALLNRSLMLRWVRFLYLLLIVQFIVFSSSQDPEVSPSYFPRGKITEAEILQDKEQRISDQFHIPPALLPRVGFWFDIYTKYASHHR